MKKKLIIEKGKDRRTREEKNLVKGEPINIILNA